MFTVKTGLTEHTKSSATRSLETDRSQQYPIIALAGPWQYPNSAPRSLETSRSHQYPIIALAGPWQYPSSNL